MSKRFGRNQKRKAREEIQRLGTDLQMAKNKLVFASSELRRRDSAAQDALDIMMKKEGLLKHAIEIISREIGKYVAKNLVAPAQKMFKDSLLQDDRALDFTISENMTMEGKSVEILRGELRANYNITLW